MRLSQPAKCATCPMARHGLCARLSTDLRGAIGSQANVYHYAAGETVWDGDGAPDFIGIVVSGYLRLQRYGLHGRRQIISLFRGGDVVGGLGRTQQDFTIEASTTARLCRVDRRAFMRLMEQDTTLQKVVYEQQLGQLEELRWLTWSLGGLAAEERFVSFLIMATTFMPFATRPLGGGILTLDLPRPDIADLLGTSVESISRISKRLETRGMIEILDPRRFLIPDLGALIDIAGLEEAFARLRPALPPAAMERLVADLVPAEAMRRAPRAEADVAIRQ